MLPRVVLWLAFALVLIASAGVGAIAASNDAGITHRPSVFLVTSGYVAAGVTACVAPFIVMWNARRL